MPHRPDDTVWTCEDIEACLARYAHSASARDIASLQVYALNERLHHNTRIGRCHECGDLVFVGHSHFRLHEGETSVLMHYSCYIERLSQKIRESMP